MWHFTLGGHSRVTVKSTPGCYRQSFCFLVRAEELPASSNASNQLSHNSWPMAYVKPIQVDDQVGLLAVVGESTRGKEPRPGNLVWVSGRGLFGVDCTRVYG